MDHKLVNAGVTQNRPQTDEGKNREAPKDAAERCLNLPNSIWELQQLRHLFFSEGYPSKLKPQPKNWFSYNPPSMGYPRLRDCLSSPSVRDGILCGPVSFFVTAVGIEDFRGGVPGLFVVTVVTGIFIIAITRLDSLWSLSASSSSPSASRNLGAVSSDCLSEAGRDNKESRLDDDEDKDSYHGGDK